MSQRQDDNEQIGSFYMGRMRPPPKPERKTPRGLITVLTLLAFAGIIWYAYPQGQEKYNAADIPLIKADTSAYKFKPDDPGGMDVPHQDSTIFDPLEKKAAAPEKLMPAPEQPVQAPAPAISADEKPMNLDTKMETVTPGTEKIVSAAPKAEPKKEIKAPEKKAAPKKEVKEAKKPAATPAKTGDVYVRLGSLRNESEVAPEWADLQKRYPQFLKGLKSRTMKVDLPGKGIYYRLEAGTVPADRAKEICAALKSTPGGCLVVK